MKNARDILQFQNVNFWDFKITISLITQSQMNIYIYIYFFFFFICISRVCPTKSWDQTDPKWSSCDHINIVTVVVLKTMRIVSCNY